MKDITIKPGGVDEYVAKCPALAQSQLKRVRNAIREVAPDSIETVSYFQLPGYSYEGYDYNGMFAWFSYKKPFVRVHVRPPVIMNHKSELAGFRTTQSIVSFPEDMPVPLALVKKLVKESIKIMKEKKSDSNQ